MKLGKYFDYGTCTWLGMQFKRFWRQIFRTKDHTCNNCSFGMLFVNQSWDDVWNLLNFRVFRRLNAALNLEILWSWNEWIHAIQFLKTFYLYLYFCNIFIIFDKYLISCFFSEGKKVWSRQGLEPITLHTICLSNHCLGV